MHRLIKGSEPWIDRTVFLLAVVAGICLVAIVAIVSLGVVMRYAFDAPLLGVNEFVQLTAVAMVMAALPSCTAQNEHVAVDVFDAAIGRWGRFVGDILARLLPAFIFSVLARRAVLKTQDALEWGDVTNMLLIPFWPFYVMVALGAGLCVVILVLQLVLILIRGPK